MKQKSSSNIIKTQDEDQGSENETDEDVINYSLLSIFQNEDDYIDVLP